MDQKMAISLSLYPEPNPQRNYRIQGGPDHAQHRQIRREPEQPGLPLPRLHGCEANQTGESGRVCGGAGEETAARGVSALRTSFGALSTEYSVRT